MIPGLRRVVRRARSLFGGRPSPSADVARDDVAGTADDDEDEAIPPMQTAGAPDDATVRAALSLVDDPEIGIDIVNLGLLRGWEADDRQLRVVITTTSPACPVGPHIQDQAREALSAAFPYLDVDVGITQDPPWTFDDMSPAARRWLGREPEPDDGEEDETMDQTLDLRDIEPRKRHPLVFGTFAELKPGTAFVLMNDHDPKPLYYQFQAEYGSVFGWEYLERGPETWRVRISRTA